VFQSAFTVDTKDVLCATIRHCASAL